MEVDNGMLRMSGGCPHPLSSSRKLPPQALGSGEKGAGGRYGPCFDKFSPMIKPSLLMTGLGLGVTMALCRGMTEQATNARRPIDTVWDAQAGLALPWTR